MYKSEQCLKHDTGNLWEFEPEGGHGLVAGNRRSDPHDRIASLYFRYSRFRPNSPGFGLSCMQL